MSNGGVVILSKWPFIGSAQYVYGKRKIFGGLHEARTCGSDALANKGFAYVEIVKNHQRFHVIGTHTQASDDMCANPAKVRRQQFRDIAEFINDAHIPKDQMVFIGGDLNVNRGNRREFAHMLTALQANEPTWLPVKKDRHTYDPTINGITAYIDGPAADKEYLDMILVEKNHAQPASFYNLPADFSSLQFYIDKSAFTKGNFWATEYSDHFPVRGFTGQQSDFPDAMEWPLTSTRSDAYDHVQFYNMGTGKYVGFRSNDGEAWLRAAEHKNDPDTRWKMSNNMLVNSSGCIQNNDYIRIESRLRKGRHWILGGGCRTIGDLPLPLPAVVCR